MRWQDASSPAKQASPGALSTLPVGGYSVRWWDATERGRDLDVRPGCGGVDARVGGRRWDELGDGGVGQAIISFQHGVWAFGEEPNKKSLEQQRGGVAGRKRPVEPRGRKFYSAVGSDEQDLQCVVRFGCPD